MPKTEKQIIFLQINMDILVGKLYGITTEEIAHLTSPEYFKVLNELQPEYVHALCNRYDK